MIFRVPMLRILGLILAAAAMIFVTACASDEQQNDPNRVSTIPWNRPEKWDERDAGQF